MLILKIERLANDVMGRTTLTCSDSLISIYCNKRISNVRITIAFTVQVNATVSQISHSQLNDYAESIELATNSLQTYVNRVTFKL